MCADSGFKRRQFLLLNNKLHIAGKRPKCIALPESTLHHYNRVIVTSYLARLYMESSKYELL